MGIKCVEDIACFLSCSGFNRESSSEQEVGAGTSPGVFSQAQPAERSSIFALPRNLVHITTEPKMVV